MEFNLKLGIEKVFLFLVFFLLLWMAVANLFGNRIKHDFPYGYMASDTFQHQTRAESIKDAGNYRNEAFYIAKGFRDVVGYYPPLIYHMGVIFSYLAGLEVYDGAYFVIFLLACFSVLLMYYVIKHFNQIVAYLSMPLSVFIFSFPIYIAFTWGHWPAVTTGLFVIASIWAIQRFELNRFYILLAIFFSAIIYTHTSEAIFVFLFILIYLLVKFVFKRLEWSEIKNYIFAGIIALIISSYFLLLFNGTWRVAQPFKLSSFPLWEGTPGFYFSSFGIILQGIIIIGMVLALFVIAKKNLNAAIIAGFVLFALGFTNYIGFSFRAFQLRFFWPLYLAVFFGLVLYKLGYEIGRYTGKKWNTIVAIIVSILLFTALIFFYYKPLRNEGLMNKYHWQAFKWIEKNTASDARIYFFYGDTYGQDALLRNVKREHYLINYHDYFESIRNQSVRRNYKMKIPGDSGAGIPYRKTLFTYGFHALEEPQEYFYGYRDICSFDYYVFDKIGSQQSMPIIQFNNIIKNIYLRNEWMKEVFSNEVTSIVKNDKPGENCLAA